MSPSQKKQKETRGRKSMFPKGRTVSFKTDEAKANKFQKAAYNRQIPFSMWMREAAEEKFAREAANA